MVISLGQLPSAGCDQNHIRSLSGVKWKASDCLRNLSPRHPHPHPYCFPNVYEEQLQKVRERGRSPHHRPRAPAQQECESWAPAAPAFPGLPGSPTATVPSYQRSSGGGRFRKTGQHTASVHAQPTPQKQLKSSAHDCQVPLSNLVDILIEERIPRGPPAEMPHVRERLFSFPFAVNEFYSWQRSGAGSHPHRS